MGAYATADDYRLYHDTTATDERLGALLGAASRLMDDEMDAAGVVVPEAIHRRARYAETLRDVAVAMVHRALGEDAGEDDGPPIPYGASQFSQGAGGYTRSATLSNPYGDLFVTESERRRLGIGLPRAAVVSPYGRGVAPCAP